VCEWTDATVKGFYTSKRMKLAKKKQESGVPCNRSVNIDSNSGKHIENGTRINMVKETQTA
jgi:hypothetical protein